MSHTKFGSISTAVLIATVALVSVTLFKVYKDYSLTRSEQSIDTFTTQRMTAHRITPRDLNNLYTLLSNPQVGETMHGTPSLEQVTQNLHHLLDHWSHHGFGTWIFYEKHSGNFVGRGGLRHELIDGKDEIALSYALMPDYWGKGLATEMAQGIIKIAFENLGLQSIVGFTDPTNIPSQKVMEKNGFVFEKTFSVGHLQPVLYRLTKGQH